MTLETMSKIITDMGYKVYIEMSRPFIARIMIPQGVLFDVTKLCDLSEEQLKRLVLANLDIACLTGNYDTLREE